MCLVNSMYILNEPSDIRRSKDFLSGKPNAWGGVEWGGTGDVHGFTVVMGRGGVRFLIKEGGSCFLQMLYMKMDLGLIGLDLYFLLGDFIFWGKGGSTIGI